MMSRGAHTGVFRPPSRNIDFRFSQCFGSLGDFRMTTLLSDPTFPSPDGFIDDGFHADLALASKPLICAINAGVEQRVFGLQPGPIRSDAQGGPDYVFVIGNDIPAAATAYDAGFDELRICVALWPSPEWRTHIRCFEPNLARRAGHVVARSWLERRTGAFLQSEGAIQFWCPRRLLSVVAGISAQPIGYCGDGSLM